MKQNSLRHSFVEFIPERLDDSVLYISQRYKTAMHKCCCGCGQEVVTPLGPTDWSLRVAGGVVTLHPSIGNWSFPCRSHYFIRSSRVVWAGSMTQREIERGRARDRAYREAYFDRDNAGKEAASRSSGPQVQPPSPGLLDKLWQLLKQLWS
jgi:hypothetical protein